MSENTTRRAVVVRGEPHEHPAVRRLARACIALARWRREQPAAVPVTVDESPEPARKDAS